MPFQKLPGGTRGMRTPPRLLSKLLTPVMMRIHRRSGDRFNGMDLPSAGGSAHHPGWYHNIAAHPDQVWAEVSGVTHRVQVEQLHGDPRDRAWALITERAPRFTGYLAKTDRQLPVLRLTPMT